MGNPKDITTRFVEWKPEEIEAEILDFERKYQVPSASLAEAFMVDGELKETEDFRRWDFVYGVWQWHLRSQH